MVGILIVEDTEGVTESKRKELRTENCAICEPSKAASFLFFFYFLKTMNICFGIKNVIENNHCHIFILSYCLESRKLDP